MTQNVESLVNKGGVWFSEPISTYAEQADSLFYFIVGSSVILFIAIAFVMFYFMVKYKRTEQRQEADMQLTHNNFLEISWTVIPTLLVLFIFYWGYKDFLEMSVPPADAKEIYVTGQLWFWEFEDPQTGLKTTNEFAVPVNTPIKLIMTSKDVIHSMFIPNFRTKRDVVPNRYTRVWFEATKEGTYQIFCTEYCGDGHSKMLAVVHVLSDEDYDEWLAKNLNQDDIPLVTMGEKVYKQKCSICHSIDGSAKIGPTWKGAYGTEQQFSDGTTGIIDEAYIEESINYPMNKIVKGYEGIPMTAFLDSLTEREMNGVIEYIKSLK